LTWSRRYVFLGFLGHAIGDPILAGRALAFISLLLVTINIVIWLRINYVRRSLALLRRSFRNHNRRPGARIDCDE
jgi:hypothetical protein